MTIGPSPSADDGTDGVRELSQATIERIAAGEVVTRPARVVIELVENALDADASRIKIEVTGDGTDRIRIIDDGHGMARDDAILAVEPHTTSKLGGADDLRRIESLGFRGEALASIAETACLKLATNDGTEVGTEVTIQKGQKTVSDIGRARGTTVEVRDLFYDRPTRRESLATPAQEFARISEAVARYALVRADTAFILTHDGTETFSTSGKGRLDALIGVYGRDTAAASTDIEYGTAVPIKEKNRNVQIAGRVCYPSITRADRSHIRVGVNGRPVKNIRLRDAVADPYDSFLAQGLFPVAVVDLTLPPIAVDANLHPAKERIGLRDEDAIIEVVREAIREALSTADLRRQGEIEMDLSSSLRPVENGSDFSETEFIGQYRDLYLLCEDEDDLLIVDQHAAHERINYERLCAGLEEETVPSAELARPRTVTLDPGAASAAASYADELRKLGFAFQPFGGTTVRLSSVPAPLGRTADVDAFRQAIEALRAGEDPDFRDDLIADLACHPSLKAGESLTRETAERLIERLGECQQPYACPHGRPTVLAIEEPTLARGFDRDW